MGFMTWDDLETPQDKRKQIKMRNITTITKPKLACITLINRFEKKKISEM